MPSFGSSSSPGSVVGLVVTVRGKKSLEVLQSSPTKKHEESGNTMHVITGMGCNKGKRFQREVGIYNFIMKACYNAYDIFVEYFQMQQRCPQRCRLFKLFSNAGKHYKMMSIINMIIHIFVNESDGEKTKISTTY